jgi:poly(3-hydroxybutyrate) depolymerase
MLLKSLATFAALAASGLCASLQQVSNFGTNPTRIQMYIYVPDRLATKPAIIVAVRNAPMAAGC